MYEVSDNDIIEIQEWAKTQRFLPKNLSKPFIQTFLLGCEGNKQKTKTVLGNYFYARQSIPEIFTNRDPLLKENIQSWKCSCFVPMKTLPNGWKVFLGTVLNTENFDYVKFVKQSFMCYDLLIKNNEWGNGDRVLILSYDKLKNENLASYTIYITRKSAECERDKYLPGKLRAVHNVHIPPFMKKIYERFQPFLTPEDEKVIYFHKNLKSLHKYIHPDILPLEFGGKAGSLKVISEKWQEILRAHRSFFIEEEEKRMQEVKTLKDCKLQHF